MGQEYSRRGRPLQEPETCQPAAQRREPHEPAAMPGPPGAHAQALAGSPRMLAQRQQIQCLFGPQRPQPPLPASGSAADRATVQRTTWRYQAKAWVNTGGSSNDTDAFAHPAALGTVPAEGDTYDQNTGAYNSPLRQSISSVGSSKGKEIGFYDGRVDTAYTVMSGTKNQGPHTFAHIAKRVAMKIGKLTGRDPRRLVGSSALPRPRRVRRMLHKLLRAKHGDLWKDGDRKARVIKYLKAYKEHYKNARDGQEESVQLDAVRRAMELNPASVYKIAEGTVSHDEIKGKGERRKSAAKDIEKIIDNPGADLGGLGLRSLDFTGAQDDEKKHASRMVSSLGNWLVTGDGGIDSGSSESDTDVDLDIDGTKKAQTPVDPSAALLLQTPLGDDSLTKAFLGQDDEQQAVDMEDEEIEESPQVQNADEDDAYMADEE